jgi:hypothetical protein
MKLWRLAPRHHPRTSGTLLALTCLALVATACSESRSAAPSRTPGHSGETTTSMHQSTLPRSTRTTSAPLSAASFFVEPCASIVGSPLSTSETDLEPFLLGATQLPAGSIIDGPHQTSNSGSRVWASVPTASPASYETITLYDATTPGGTATLRLDEVIGDVGSASFASQLLSMLDADLNGPDCNPNGTDTVHLPGSSPAVTATVSGGQGSSGSVRGEKLFAAQGSRLLCLTWTSNVAVNARGLSSAPNLPPLPDGPGMAQVLYNALALISN